MQTLGERRHDLYADPDVSLIGEVCADGTDCFTQLDVQLRDLTSKGWKVDGTDQYQAISVQVEKFDGDTIDTSLLVTLRVIVRRPENGGSIVDRDGNEIAKVEADTKAGMNTENLTILARVGPPDDPWRIVSQTRLREVPA